MTVNLLKIYLEFEKKMNAFTGMYTNKKLQNKLHKNMSVTSLNHLDLKNKNKL